VKTKRAVLILVAVVVLVTAALVLRRSRPAAAPSASKTPPVAIEDGKTIDFSSGKPVVKDSTKEKAAIDAAVKEMDEAAKDVSFGPTTAPAPADAKK
jgi:hypothetical protein